MLASNGLQTSPDWPSSRFLLLYYSWPYFFSLICPDFLRTLPFHSILALVEHCKVFIGPPFILFIPLDPLLSCCKDKKGKRRGDTHKKHKGKKITLQKKWTTDKAFSWPRLRQSTHTSVVLNIFSLLLLLSPLLSLSYGRNLATEPVFHCQVEFRFFISLSLRSYWTRCIVNHCKSTSR